MRRIKRPRKRGARRSVDPSLLQYPRKQSEFEIQAYLFSELRGMGLDARGEVRAGRESRFDIVVFEEKDPVLIIEVKTRRLPRNPSSPRMREMSRRRAEQAHRYKQYLDNVVWIEGMRQAELFIQKKREEIQQRGG